MSTTKGVAMNESAKQSVMDKQFKPIIDDKQRGVGTVELLNAVAILGAAVVVAAMRYPKLPSWMSD
jgi:hypothetical protein